MFDRIYRILESNSRAVRHARSSAARKTARELGKLYRIRESHLLREIQDLHALLAQTENRHRKELRVSNQRVTRKLRSIENREDYAEQQIAENFQLREKLTEAIAKVEHSQLTFNSTVDLLRRTAGVASASEDSARRVIESAKVVGIHGGKSKR